MDILFAILACIAIGPAIYLVLAHSHHSRTWAALERSFSPAWKLTREQLKASKPCALTVNGHLIAEGAANERFSLARPYVLVVESGIVFLVRPNPLGIFRAILVRYDQVQSFGHVRDLEGQWIEIEFTERGTHCWAHLPVQFAKALRAHGIAQGIPPYRLRPLLDEAEEPTRAPAASVYSRAFGCSTWVAEALETLDNRDVVDAYHDVDALWGAAFEWHRQQTWTKAEAMIADPATSYWLRATLGEIQSRPDLKVFDDVAQLLRIVRDRMDRALGASGNSVLSLPVKT